MGAIPDTSISGRRVARELTAIVERRGNHTAGRMLHFLHMGIDDEMPGCDRGADQICHRRLSAGACHEEQAGEAADEEIALDRAREADVIGVRHRLHPYAGPCGCRSDTQSAAQASSDGRPLRMPVRHRLVGMPGARNYVFGQMRAYQLHAQRHLV